MCTFTSADMNIDDAELQKLLAQNGGKAPGAADTPAGGGDKGMGPDPITPPQNTTQPDNFNPPATPGTTSSAPTSTPLVPPEDTTQPDNFNPPASPGATSSAPTSTPAQNASGSWDANAAWDANAFLAARPDVMAEYNSLISRADRNSPWFAEHGLNGGASGFATWYAGQNGINTSSTARGGASAGSGGASTGADGAATTGNDLITSLTKGFNDAISSLNSQNQAQIDQITGLNANLTNQLGAQQKAFAASQQELIDRMQKTAAEQSAKFAGALKDMQNAGKETGQNSKKPNYGRALARNKDLNSTGLSSTMLTGPGGVTPSAGQLGMTSLLGA